eukprot:593216-Amphidinium_carterae.1
MAWTVSYPQSRVDFQSLEAGLATQRRHGDLEGRPLAAFPAGVQIVWMKAHQSDKDAEEICEGIVRLSLQPTTVPVRMCPLSLLRNGRTGVRCGSQILVGPELRTRPEVLGFRSLNLSLLR